MVKRVKRMIAVLVDAKEPGSTGWTAVRSSRKIKVEGLICGHLIIEFDGNGKKIPSWNILEDIDKRLPQGVERVRVKLIEVNKGSRVSVDME